MHESLVLSLVFVGILGILTVALGIYGTWYEIWGPGAKTCESGGAADWIGFIPTGLGLALLPLAFKLLT
jgi:hypothetical protein